LITFGVAILTFIAFPLAIVFPFVGWFVRVLYQTGLTLTP